MTVSLDKYLKLGTKWTESGKGQKKFGGWDSKAIEEHAKLRSLITQCRQHPKSIKLETKILDKVREINDIKGNTSDEYKSLIGKKPSKAKGKDTELMPNQDMTGDNVLAFSDDSDDDSDDESAEPPKEEEEEDGDPFNLTRNLAAYPESCSMFKYIQSIGVVNNF